MFEAQQNLKQGSIYMLLIDHLISLWLGYNITWWATNKYSYNSRSRRVSFKWLATEVLDGLINDLKSENSFNLWLHLITSALSLYEEVPEVLNSRSEKNSKPNIFCVFKTFQVICCRLKQKIRDEKPEPFQMFLKIW